MLYRILLNMSHTKIYNLIEHSPEAVMITRIDDSTMIKLIVPNNETKYH